MPRTPSLVSVVVPAFDARAWIDVQLAALADQDYPGAVEVIVADNGSTDSLAAHLANHPLAERLRLRCVDAGDARGAAHARNVGVAAARGDFLAFCDADDRAHPGWLRALVARAADCDAASGPVEATTLNAPRVAAWTPVNPPEVRSEVPGMFPVAGSCNLGMWRETADAVGLWDNAFRSRGEDADYCLRIQLAGLTFGHEPTAVMAYRLKSSYPQLWRQQYAWGRSDVDLYVKYRDRGHRRRAPALAAAMPILLLLRNPLLPQRITGLPAGAWLCYLAGFAGRVTGSARHRVVYV